METKYNKILRIIKDWFGDNFEEGELDRLILDIIETLEDDIEQESTIDVLESEKENLTRTLEECGEIISQAKEIVEWLLTHNKNYTKKQYYKLLDLQEILDGE